MRESTETTPAGSAPLADAADLALRLVEETARRQQAEARAETATATADAETARAALVGLRATAVQSIATVQARDSAGRMEAMHQGLLALRTDLDGLRAAAEAAIVAATPAAPPLTVTQTPASASSTEPSPDVAPTVDDAPAIDDAPVASPAADPARPAIAPLDGGLASSAQELLARGRLDVADEVIRGLEDAAARLRAQATPSIDD